MPVVTFYIWVYRFEYVTNEIVGHLMLVVVVMVVCINGVQFQQAFVQWSESIPNSSSKRIDSLDRIRIGRIRNPLDLKGISLDSRAEYITLNSPSLPSEN